MAAAFHRVSTAHIFFRNYVVNKNLSIFNLSLKMDIGRVGLFGWVIWRNRAHFNDLNISPKPQRAHLNVCCVLQ